MCDPAKNILYISMKCFHFFHSFQIAFLYSHLSFQILPLHLQVIFLEELQAGVSFHLEGIYTVQRNRTIPVNIYLFKVKNRNIRKSCEIYSKLTKHQNDVTGVILMFLLLTLNIFLHFFLVFLLLTWNK